MTRTPMTFTLWTATCIAVITVLGCGDEIADPGTVIAEWDITIGCTVSEVSEVEARLVDLQSNLGNNSYDSAFRTCNDAEPIVFGRVPAGFRQVPVGFRSAFGRLPAGREPAGSTGLGCCPRSADRLSRRETG